MSTERRSETNRSGSRSSGGNRAGSTAHRAGNTNVRRVNKKTAKADRILKLSGYVITAIMMIVGIVAIVFVAKLKLLPMKYLVIGGVALLAVGVLFIALQNWRISGLITKALALIAIVVMVIGCAYVRYTQSKVSDMTGIATKIDNIQVYVLKDDPAQTIMDAKDYEFGILRELDRKNTDTFMGDLTSEVGQELKVTEQEDVYLLASALYNGQVKAIIMNSAYEGFFKDTVGYEDFSDRVKSIATKDIKTDVEKAEENKDYLHGENTFTIYVSGVDTRGSLNSNSNSDVNILITINRTTHQILLLTTPRDFYVPLSISGGVPDKLTHAGGHGIDVSKDTLAMLYEVNVEHYVKINFIGFEKIINTLGGISVWSDYAFSEVLEESEAIDIHEGWNDLNGSQALTFARTRHGLEGGDRARGKNQLIVIEAVFDKLISPSILSNYTQLLDDISDCMVTSMSYDDIAELVREQLDSGAKWDIQKYSVNGFDASGPTWSAGSQELYVMEPDMETVNTAKELLRKMYNDEMISVPEE